MVKKMQLSVCVCVCVYVRVCIYLPSLLIFFCIVKTSFVSG